jgi:hypothetical protein
MSNTSKTKSYKTFSGIGYAAVGLSLVGLICMQVINGLTSLGNYLVGFDSGNYGNAKPPFPAETSNWVLVPYLLGVVMLAYGTLKNDSFKIQASTEVKSDVRTLRIKGSKLKVSMISAFVLIPLGLQLSIPALSILMFLASLVLVLLLASNQRELKSKQ